MLATLICFFEARPAPCSRHSVPRRPASHGAWIRVGPLARVNACDFIDTPEAESSRREFMGVTNGRPNNLTMAYHWARMIELQHACEKMQELLHDPDLQGDDLIAPKGERRGE